MKLTDLRPMWITEDGRRGGKRIGFLFESPVERSVWQSCFETPPKTRRQIELFELTVGDDIVQPCNPKHRWQIAGGIDGAAFETITVTPSLDGSAAGLWHGHITNGQIVGGLEL